MRTRAALFREPGRPLEVRPIELREPRPGEVLVRMAAVGICGTDLHVVKASGSAPRRWCWATRARAWSRRSARVSRASRSAIASSSLGAGLRRVRRLPPRPPRRLHHAAAGDRRGHAPGRLHRDGAGRRDGLSRHGDGALSERLVVGADVAAGRDVDIPLERRRCRVRRPHRRRRGALRRAAAGRRHGARGRRRRRGPVRRPGCSHRGRADDRGYRSH